jgi:hypothetical protein
MMENEGIDGAKSIRVPPKYYALLQQVKDTNHLKSIPEAVEWLCKNSKNQEILIQDKFDEMQHLVEKLKRDKPYMVDLIYFFGIAFDKSNKNPLAADALRKIMVEFMRVGYKEEDKPKEPKIPKEPKEPKETKGE